MRNLIKLCAIALVIFTACKSEKSEKTIEQPVVKTATNFDAFGEVISADEAMTSSEMFAKYNAMQVGDTVSVKFASKINDVCSKKGCWMKLPVGEKEAMVRFKDYGFFMPLDSKYREVIVEGKAFVELKHYAEDAGKSLEEIAKITEPKTEFAFEADGVLMKK